MDEQAKPSPLPWDVVPSCEHHGAYIVTDFGTTICNFYAMSDPSAPSLRNGGTSKPLPFVDADANAAFVVLAVNCHDDLVEALKMVDQHFGNTFGPRVSEKVRAAIAKARGAV